MFNDNSEKRKFERINSTVPLQYKKLKELSEGTVGAITQDVSEGGAKFLANEFLPLATRLVVELFLPAQPRPIKAISKVAWIRKAPSGNQYEIGNQFLDVGKDDKGQLAEYVKRTQEITP
ncbi:MAG: PilZ domain-containing protein [Candidatus Omnitrophica bacterium]|nr:PilZ domain-containing protein [Candidatus Omnitrophota bacterium]